MVQEELYGVRTRWYNLGLKLGLKADTLDAIKSKCSGDPNECFQEMLKDFLKKTTPSPSWRSLADALRSPIVDQPQLAEKVEQTHCLAPKLPGKHLLCIINFQLYILSQIYYRILCCGSQMYSWPK